MFNLNLDEAKNAINSEIQLNPENKLIHYNRNYIDFINVVIQDDKDEYDEFIELSDKRIQKILSDKSISEWRYYAVSEMFLHRAIARILNDKLLFVGFDIYRSYYYLQKNLRQYPEFSANNKLSGLYNILIDMIPDEYQWMFSLIGVNGNFKLGIDQLQKFCDYSEKDTSFQVEGVLIAYYIDKYLSRDFLDNDESINGYLKKSEDYSILRYLIGSSLIRNRKIDEAEQLLFNREQQKDEIKILHFNYVRGLCKLYNNEKETLYFLYQFISDYKGRFYKKDAMQKLAWYYFINEDLDSFKQLNKEILTNSDMLLEPDKQAFYEAKKQKVSNPILLKARILFDASKYTEVITLLEKSVNKFRNSDEISYLNYKYRLARAYHLNNDYLSALSNYQFVIDNGNELNDYKYSFSLLQCALVYETLNKVDKAEEYLLQCLTTKNNEYHFSIEFKAKIAMQRIKSNDESITTSKI